MEVSPSTATGAPRPLAWRGRDIPVYPLRLKDWGEFNAWVEEQFFDLLTRAAEWVGDSVASAAAEAAGRTPINSATDIWSAIADTDLGTAKLLSIQSRDRLTFADAAEIINDGRAADMARAKMRRANKLPEDPTFDTKSESKDASVTYRLFALLYHWTPLQISELTFAQLLMLLYKDDCDSAGRPVVKVSSLEEAIAVSRRLKLARENRRADAQAV